MRVDRKVELERRRIVIIQCDLHFKLEKRLFLSMFIAFVCIIVNGSRSLFAAYIIIRTQLHHDFNMP